MVRRASGGRTHRVPGVHAAVRSHLVDFAQQWHSSSTWRDVEALDRFDLVVHADTLWRALFDPRHPAEADRFLGDPGFYRITGPDSLENAPAGPDR